MEASSLEITHSNHETTRCCRKISESSKTWVSENDSLIKKVALSALAGISATLVSCAIGIGTITTFALGLSTSILVWPHLKEQQESSKVIRSIAIPIIIASVASLFTVHPLLIFSGAAICSLARHQ